MLTTATERLTEKRYKPLSSSVEEASASGSVSS